MHQYQIKKCLETGRVQLTNTETFEFYLFWGLNLLFSIVFFVLMIPEVGQSSLGLFFVPIPLALMAYWAYKKYQSLRFRKFRIEHAADYFKAAAQATALELGWKIEHLTESVFIAKSKRQAAKLLPLRVTVLREGDVIFSNSFGETPFNWASSTKKSNQKNVETFNKNLILSIKGENVLEKALEEKESEEMRFANESEWTWKNAWKRIATYFLAFVVIGCCIVVLSEGFNLIILLIAVFCLGYLVLDWIVIIQKMIKKRVLS